MNNPVPSDTTRVLWIRHGETAWNTEKRFQGHLDIPLNDTGRYQAARLATRWSPEAGELGLPTPAQIYASDLARAVDTARHVALALGQTVTPLTALRERHYGDLAGLTADEMARQRPLAYQGLSQRTPDAVLPGGESLNAFYRRIVQAADALTRQHRGQTLCVVVHGGVLDCLYRHATGTDIRLPRQWLLANASVNIIDHRVDDWALVAWGDTRHLTANAADEVDGRVA